MQGRRALGVCAGEDLGDVLFAMADGDRDSILLVEVFCQMLGGIDAAMLTTRTAEREHQIGKTALEITLDMGISQPIHTV